LFYCRTKSITEGIRGLLKDCCESREKSAWEQHAALRTAVEQHFYRLFSQSVLYVYAMFQNFQTNHCGTFMKL